MPVLGFTVALLLPMATCAEMTSNQQAQDEFDTNENVSALNRTKRAMVSELVQATLKAAQATSWDELFTYEELQHLLTIQDIVGKTDDERDGQKEESDADRRARLIAEAPLDYDCMEREFDVLADDFDVQEAAMVYNKCRIVVLRNVFNKKQMERFIQISQDFVVGLQEGWMDRDAPMYNGNEPFYSQRSEGKWEVLLPDYFLKYAMDFAEDPILLDFVRDPQVLDSDAIYGGSGVILAEPGSDAGHWHTDGSFILGDNSLFEYGLAGHDLPPYSINMATPMVPNLPNHAGLTEYCIGSSHVSGAMRLPDDRKWQDSDLFWDMVTSEYECPPNNWRAPNVQPGDVIFWDYQIRHRSGANQSPHLRPLIFSSYNRPWFADPNFGGGLDDGDSEFIRERQMADMPDPYVATCHNATSEGKSDLCHVAPSVESGPLSMTDRLVTIREFLNSSTTPMRFNPHREISFDVANKDVSHLEVIVSETRIPLEPGEHGTLTTTVGSELLIKVGCGLDEETVQHHRWTVRKGQEQLILSHQLLNGLLRPFVEDTTKQLRHMDSSERSQNDSNVIWRPRNVAYIKSWNRIEANKKTIIFQMGEVVYREGDDGLSWVYSVADEDGGMLSASRDGIKLFDYEEGEYVGECSLLFGSKRSSTVTCATETCRLYEMQASDFLQLMTSSPMLAKELTDNCHEQLLEATVRTHSPENSHELSGEDIFATF